MKIHSRYQSLDRATDREFMKALFNKYLGEFLPGSKSLVELQIPRLFPQPNDAFVIQYELRIELAGGEIQPLLIGGGLLGSGQDLPGTIMLDENMIRCDDIPLLLVVFPHDPALPGLRQLIKGQGLPVRIKTAIGRHLEAYQSSGGLEVSPLGWRPGRRAVVQISVGRDENEQSGSIAEALIVKLVRPRKAEKLFGRMGKLYELAAGHESDRKFVIPAIYASDPESGMMLMSRTEGENLFQLIGDDRFVTGCCQAGRLLRDLHSIKDVSLPSHNWTKELYSTRSTVKRTIELFENAAELLSSPLEKLAIEGNSLNEESELTTIHRDFYDKQVIPGEPWPALLDLDNLSLGDPAQDVGNFLAHLELRSRQFPERGSWIKGGETAFLTGYGTAADQFWDRVTKWKQLTLVRLTCLYLLRPHWRAMAPELMSVWPSANKTELQPRGNI